LGREETQELTVIDKQPDGQLKTRAVISERFGQWETIVREWPFMLRVVVAERLEEHSPRQLCTKGI
jgi:hypothetical protein